MPAHTKLKFRKGDQVVDRQKALKESLLKLEKAEKEANKKLLQRPAVDETVEEEGKLKLLKQTAEVDDTAIRKKYDDADASSDDNDDGGDGWSEAENDDLDASSSDDDSDGDSDDDSDDDDEEAALQAELAKIRAEREEAKRKQEQEETEKDEAKLEEAALLGNPLLSSDDTGGSGRLKRRWNEDVVFRNQAKGEPEIKKRFINDTVRNDFHKRFLNKFVR
jgi:protein CWC15